MLSVMGAFAEFERALIGERQREGIALAKQRGAYRGRKKSLSPEQAAQLRQRVQAGSAEGPPGPRVWHQSRNPLSIPPHTTLTMPRGSLLTPAERASLLAFATTDDELIRHYTFSERVTTSSAGGTSPRHPPEKPLERVKSSR